MRKITITIAVALLIIGIGVGTYILFFQKDAVDKSGNDLQDAQNVEWRNVEFKDANTGETFKVSDFKGQNILLESFAVWCPTCLSQQKEMKKLRDQGDDTVHISLDTDPNEDESIVKEHALNNNLDWRFAVSPNEATKSLIKDFGINIVFAPGAPVLLICDDDAQSARFLPAGVKDADKLQQEIDKGC